MPKGIYDRETAESRFWKKVERSDTCWNWLGSKSEDGYGWFTENKKTITAHRYSYLLHKGEIPEGNLIRHTCDNRDCVNPDHLILGTPADNSLDMILRDRQAKGDKNGAAVLTEAQAREILEEYKTDKQSGRLYGSLARLSQKYGVDKQVVSRLTAGKTWRHLHD